MFHIMFVCHREHNSAGIVFDTWKTLLMQDDAAKNKSKGWLPTCCEWHKPTFYKSAVALLKKWCGNLTQCSGNFKCYPDPILRDVDFKTEFVPPDSAGESKSKKSGTGTIVSGNEGIPLQHFQFFRFVLKILI